MKIKSAQFVVSSSQANHFPTLQKPEFAFIGRSNVGKSSLLNYVAGQKGLAKTSRTPGKTQTINHFIINKAWYWVDLPGYGYAKTSRHTKEKWQETNGKYLRNQRNLSCTFILIDARHPAERIDMEFIAWMDNKKKPFAIVLTKIDKLAKYKHHSIKEHLKEVLARQRTEIPAIFSISSHQRIGCDTLLDYIAGILDKK